MKNSILFYITMMLSALLFVACTQNSHKNIINKKQVLASLDSAKLGSTFVAGVKNGDFETQASIYAEDAIYSHPIKPPVQGRDSIRAVLKRNTPSGADVSIQTEDKQVVGSEAVYSYGTITYSFSSDEVEQPQEMSSTYFLLYQQTEEGWKITRESLSLNHPSSKSP